MPNAKVLLGVALTAILMGSVIVWILTSSKEDGPLSLDRINATAISAPDEFMFEGSAQEISSSEVTTESTTDRTTETTTVEASTEGTTAFIPFNEDDKAELPQCSAILSSNRPECTEEM